MILEMYKQNPNYDLEIFNEIIDDTIVEVENEVVAYGILKPFAEAVITLDHTRSKRIKLEAIQQMLWMAEKKCKEMKISNLHFFTENEQFAQLMMNKFDFQEIMGKSFVKELK